MSASEGLRIISVAKSLEPYQRDTNLARFFGATQLAGRAGNFLSSLRNQEHISWDKFIAHAANACLDGPAVRAQVLPWLKSNGFVDVGPGEKPAIACNVVDHDAILRATSKLFRGLDPSSEE